jgi:hypothetical protein
VSTAYTKILLATIYMGILEKTADLMPLFKNNGRDQSEIVERLIREINNSNRSATEKVSNMIERLSIEPINNVNTFITLCESYSYIVIAYGLLSKSQAEIDGLLQKQDIDDFKEKGFSAIYYSYLVQYFLELCEDALEITDKLDGPQLAKSEVIEYWSDKMSEATNANLKYFDALIINDAAKGQNVAKEMMQAAYIENESSYMLSLLSNNLIRNIKNTNDLKINDPLHKQAALLGASIFGYIYSSSIINNYYSLGATYDYENQTLKSITRRPALYSMLDNSTEIAKENISGAQNNSLKPHLSIFHYRNGRILHEGSIEEKLEALQEFWLASIYSKIASELIRKEN